MYFFLSALTPARKKKWIPKGFYLDSISTCWSSVACPVMDDQLKLMQLPAEGSYIFVLYFQHLKLKSQVNLPAISRQ